MFLEVLDGILKSLQYCDIQRQIYVIISSYSFILYTDEFEINNPLGSHSNFRSVSAFYYSLP